MTELQAANAVSDSLFATTLDPYLVALQRRQERRQRIAASVARWHAWLEANLESTLALSNIEIELRPAVVAWWFPTGGQSRHDPEAPVIGRHALLTEVESSRALRTAMCRAFDRMMSVLGLAERDGRLRWLAEPRPWALGARHDRRVYRMLRSMHSAGLQPRSAMLMAFLEAELAGDPKRAEALAWYRHQVAS